MSNVKRVAPEELMSQQGGGPATAGLLCKGDRGPVAPASLEPLARQDLLH